MSHIITHSQPNTTAAAVKKREPLIDENKREKRLPEGTLTARALASSDQEIARQLARFMNGADRREMFNKIEKAFAGKTPEFSHCELTAMHDISTAISMGTLSLASYGVSNYELRKIQKKLISLSGNGGSAKGYEKTRVPASEYADCGEIAAELQEKGCTEDANKAAKWIATKFVGLRGKGPYPKSEVGKAIEKYAEAQKCCANARIVLADEGGELMKDGRFPTITAAARAAYRDVGINLNTLMLEMFHLDWKAIKRGNYEGYTPKDVAAGIAIIRKGLAEGKSNGKKGKAAGLEGCDPYMVLPTRFGEIRNYGSADFGQDFLSASRDYFVGIIDREFDNHVYCQKKNGLGRETYFYAGPAYEDEPITPRFAAVHFSKNVSNLMNSSPEARMLVSGFTGQWSGILASYGRRGMGNSDEAVEAVHATGMHAAYIEMIVKAARMQERM